MISRKITVPTLPASVVHRPRLVDRLTGHRVALLVAPAGYGKTVAARQLVDALPGTTAWITLDLVDEQPAVFWQHLVSALRAAVPALDDEPELLLQERGPHDPLFLAALLVRLDQLDEPVTLVIDGVTQLTDRRTLDGVTSLVEHGGDALRVVLTGRRDPALPVARWASAGWLATAREDELRLTPDETIELAHRGAGLSRRTALVLHERSGGWPIGLAIAVANLATVADPDAAVRTVADSDRLLGDYLVTEVLDRLPERVRTTALELAVLPWFDDDLCRDLLGPDALDDVADLHQRRAFLTVLDDERGAARFHDLVRRLFERELRRRDRRRHDELHRRAAGIWRARGRTGEACHHLLVLGDERGARDVVLEPTLVLVDRGDRQGLLRALRALPDRQLVTDPSLALDIALAWIFAGYGDAADEVRAWLRHAAHVDHGADPAVARRAHVTSAMLELLSADVDAATAHVRRHDELRSAGGATTPIEDRLLTSAARLALARGDVDDAEHWLDRAAEVVEPVTVTAVTVPALRAWCHLERGHLARALDHAERAVAACRSLDMRPHHGAIEAFAAAAWARLGAGDIEAASRLADDARADADELGWPWNTLRVAVLRSSLLRLGGAADDALAAVESIRAGRPADRHDAVDRLLARTAAAAHLAAGRPGPALGLITGDDSPAALVLRARATLPTGGRGPVERLLAGRADWPIHARLSAEALLAGTDPGADAGRRLADALRDGATSGWVSPFLDQPPVVLDRIGRLAVDELHPRLAAVLSAPRRSAELDRLLVVPLTEREQSLLALLPTHLTYAQIGAELYVSVNTVKSNLKSVYRKLAVSSRSEAVAAARELGLL